MNYENDDRIVLTLDAGGTNFVFSAISGNREVTTPIIVPSCGDNLEKCLDTIIAGFKKVWDNLDDDPVAFSFAFPGPANYPAGIIGVQKNLLGFQKEVALGPMLEEIFKLPVFINNDGNLFVLGEAMAGFLPYVNQLLAASGSAKRFSNLFGITLGTGFGGGIITGGNMLIGDNSAAGEIWAVRHKLERDNFAEEGASIRAVTGFYRQLSEIKINECPDPGEIYRIGLGEIPGNQVAAREAFRKMGEIIGDALANAITLIDGLIVIGGGLSAASTLFLPEVVREMNGTIGQGVPRLEVTTYNLENPEQLEDFIKGKQREIRIPHSKRTLKYDSLQRVGVGISRLGTTKAVGIGAYAFALGKLNSVKH